MEKDPASLTEGKPGPTPEFYHEQGRENSPLFGGLSIPLLLDSPNLKVDIFASVCF